MINENNLYTDLSNCHPKLQRGMVWCHECGKSQKVDSAKSFRDGWPKCCNLTMSIDSPEERKGNGNTHQSNN